MPSSWAGHTNVKCRVEQAKYLATPVWHMGPSDTGPEGMSDRPIGMGHEAGLRLPCLRWHGPQPSPDSLRSNRNYRGRKTTTRSCTTLTYFREEGLISKPHSICFTVTSTVPPLTRRHQPMRERAAELETIGKKRHPEVRYGPPISSSHLPPQVGDG